MEFTGNLQVDAWIARNQANSVLSQRLVEVYRSGLQPSVFVRGRKPRKGLNQSIAFHRGLKPIDFAELAAGLKSRPFKMSSCARFP